jgi:hypothetical protein
MQSDFLTRLERAGGSGVLSKNATLSERKALALHLNALRAHGHAIVADETYESGETIGELRVIHYLSCKACKEAA